MKWGHLEDLFVWCWARFLERSDWTGIAVVAGGGPGEVDGTCFCLALFWVIETFGFWFWFFDVIEAEDFDSSFLCYVPLRWIRLFVYDKRFSAVVTLKGISGQNSPRSFFWGNKKNLDFWAVNKLNWKKYYKIIKWTNIKYLIKIG